MRDRYNIERHENGMISFTRINIQEGASIHDNDVSPGLFAKGWGNGFVAIPEGHKLYGVPHGQLKVTAHSGLTYSQFEEIDDMQYWVIGFYTDGNGDNLNNCNEEYVISETDFLYTQLKSL